MDEAYDVVVLGFGGAGAAAAISAAQRGARVLVLERFYGGGATAKSGGVVYAGGGTAVQRVAGVEDSVDRMVRYLAKETGGACRDTSPEGGYQHLKGFCERSADDLAWLRDLGVRFPTKVFYGKTTQPPGDCGLFFSGNETVYDADPTPVPRGHVPQANSMGGKALFEPLRKAAVEMGVEVRYGHKGVGLLHDGSGCVEGVEVLGLRDDPVTRALHRFLFGVGLMDRRVGRALHHLERLRGRSYRVQAHGGVVLATGGFVFNEAMMRHYAPRYAGCFPLGTPGDDGSGILMGRGVGGAVARMDDCAAWRFIYPPESFVRGVLVDGRGCRLGDESLYGATLGRLIKERGDGAAHLLMDTDLVARVREEIREEERLRDHPLRKLLSGELNALVFRKLSTFLNTCVNCKKASTLEGLERKLSIPEGGLVSAVREHNAALEAGKRDVYGKKNDFRQALKVPPFLAVDCSLENPLFLGPCITLGGLVTDPGTGAVLDHGGGPIGGLFAVGRTARGVCAGGYVSGLSISDGFFSGRNAGTCAAQAAHGGGGD